MIGNFLCLLGFHLKKEVNEAMSHSETVHRHWFDSGRTTKCWGKFQCDSCCRFYEEYWSYNTPYDQWAWGGDGKTRDRKGRIIKESP